MGIDSAKAHFANIFYNWDNCVQIYLGYQMQHIRDNILDKGVIAKLRDLLMQLVCLEQEHRELSLQLEQVEKMSNLLNMNDDHLDVL